MFNFRGQNRTCNQKVYKLISFNFKWWYNLDIKNFWNFKQP